MWRQCGVWRKVGVVDASWVVEALQCGTSSNGYVYINKEVDVSWGKG